MDALKDASATAIYGVRGANCVIQITTKKGFLLKVALFVIAFAFQKSLNWQLELDRYS